MVSSGTDEEGWQYSTCFANVDKPREGGRASKRITDSVRKRKWAKAMQVMGLPGKTDGLAILEKDIYRPFRMLHALFALPLGGRGVYSMLCI